MRATLIPAAERELLVGRETKQDSHHLNPSLFPLILKDVQAVAGKEEVNDRQVEVE